MATMVSALLRRNRTRLDPLPMRWPLRYQIMLPMAALMLLTVLVVGGLGAWLSARASRARIESQIASVTHILAESNFPLTDAVLLQMKALSGADMVLVDAGGKLISSSGPPDPFAAVVRDSTMPTHPQISLGNRQWVRDRGYFHTVVPITNRGAADQAATLHILYPEEEYRRAWQRAVYPSLGFMVLALPIVMLLAATTASRISGRMSRLQGQVDRIAEGNFQQLALAERDDEIRALGQAVNRMAAMLARYEDEVRRTERMRTLAQLGGGIAHQLRNSATGASLALELHAQECAFGGRSESLEIAKRQLRLMEEHIRRFLQLGKPAGDAAVSEVDLSALVDELLPLVRPAAQHARVDLRWDHRPGEHTISGNVAALSQLTINLLVNAIEAAAQHAAQSNTPGRVAVEVVSAGFPAPAQGSGREGEFVVLVVSDSGLGPGDGIAAQLFEPFVSAKPDGVGLGLAVAHDVVLQHDGHIRWERADGMTRFIVELPASRCREPSGTVKTAAESESPARLAGPTSELQRA